MISHQLAILPDANDVGEEEDGGVFVDRLPLGLGDVGFNAADFDGAACGIASVEGSINVRSKWGEGERRGRGEVLVLDADGAAG